MNMSPFIAKMIIKEAVVSEANGQAKYRAYFVNTAIYAMYQADVNTILETEGYGNCIVTV